MPFEYGVDHQFIALRTAQQCIRRLIRPIEAQGRREGHKEIIEEIVSRIVISHEAIAHLGPGEVVDPCWVGCEELGGSRGHPFGEAVVVFLRGGDLPAHDEEHDVQDCYFLRQCREVRKGG